MNNFPDAEAILKNTKNKDKLKVILKKTESKGFGVFATKFIKKGEIIAYYKITVAKHKSYYSPTDYTYAVKIYKRDKKIHKKYIGDIDCTSFPQPLNGIPYWAPFINEPSKNERMNALFDPNLEYNYDKRKRITEDSNMIYKIVALKNINPSDEILWLYGEDYERDYEVNKSI